MRVMEKPVTPTSDQLRELLAQTGLGQREAARVLKKQYRVRINEREFRHYLTGRNVCPEVVYRALRDLANEATNH